MFNLLEMAMVYAAADTLAIAAVLHLVFVTRQAPLPFTFQSIGVQCMTLLLALVTSQSIAGIAGMLAAATVLMRALVIQSPRGYILFQLTGLLGIYRALLGTDSSIWPRVAIALLHMYLLLSNLSPEDGKTVRIYIDKLFYVHEWKLMHLNQIRKIKLEDIQQLPERFRLHTTYGEFKYNVQEPLFLIRAIARMVWRPVLPLYILYTVLKSMDVAVIMLEGIILNCLDSPGERPWYYGYFAGLGFMAARILKMQYFHVDAHITAEVNRAIGAVEMEIFRQPLVANTKQTTRRRTISTQHMESFSYSLQQIHQAACRMIAIVAGFWPIYYHVGRLAFIPIAISFCVTGMEEGLRMLVGSQWEWEKDTYSHDSKVDEIYQGIKSIKLFGWEKMFLDKGIQERETDDDDELPWYASVIWYAWEFIHISNVISGHLSSYIVIRSFIGSQSEAAATAVVITNADMFQLHSHIENVRSEIESMLFFATQIRKLISGNIRIESVLRGDPIDTLPQHERCAEEATSPSVTLDNCDFKWKKRDKEPVLHDISLKAAAGELVAVVGRTGSGKSSLLLSICGEVEQTKGAGGVVGTIGYLEQSPWIMNASFRDNVIFGRDYEKELFEKIVYACALSEDLAQWPDRDLTIIGDRGVNISGGQRARLALARTLYSQADIYMLDDPLSAVDAHVKRHLLDHVILDTGMLAGKLRIVSTHVKNFLPFAHQVIELLNGTATVSQQEPKVSRPLQDHKHVECNAQPGDADRLPNAPANDKQAENPADADTTSAPDTKEENINKDNQEDEEAEKHSIWENAVYVFQFCGLPVIAAIILVGAIEPIVTFILDGRELRALKNNSESLNNDTLLYYLQLRILNEAASSVMKRIASTLKEYISTRHLNQSVKDLFVNSLIHAPMSLFDSTTRQQVSSAYNNGAKIVANEIPRFFLDEIPQIISVFLTVWHVGCNAPLLLMAAPVIAFAIEKREKWIYSTIRACYNIQRVIGIDSSRTNDIIADGKRMIRLFGTEAHFTRLYMEDNSNTMRVELLLEPLYALSTTTYNTVKYCGDMMISSMSLAQSQFTSYSVMSGECKTFQRMLDSLASSTADMVKLPSHISKFSADIDRFRQFVAIPAEAPYIVDECRPPSHWPEQGHIELCDFSVKYRKDLEPALKDINLTVRPGEKIGIVGRTGSGKSTLAKSLFRLAGPHMKGKILIDGQDISAMGVGDLRPCLGIIPQEASMFGGSFKRNLDPLYQYSAEDIWAALIKCKVAEKVSLKTNGESGREYDDDEYDQEYEEELEAATRRWNHAGWAMRLALLLLVEKPQAPKKRRVRRYGLNRKVDGSSSFSNGEQQLFSLCRLLMRKRRIIILDEATAEVDLETDGEVQRLIRDEFSHCTILTIAHRLETIMNSDRIVVMDQGRVVEMGPPQQLIESGGYFADLVKTNEF